MPSTILSDNGVSSGSAGIKTTGSNDGALALQTTTAGGTATTAVTIDTSQQTGFGTASPTARVTLSGTGAAVAQDFTNTTSSTGRRWRVVSGDNGNAYITDMTGSADILSIGSSGNTIALQGGSISSGAGIAFPATQVASSNANTLDDYEEGTWTPSLSFTGGGSVTYTARTGQYTKVGNLVSVTFWIYGAGRSSPSGDVSIIGFPFASNNTESRPAALLRVNQLTLTGSVTGFIPANSSYFATNILNNGALGTALQGSNITGNNFEFGVSISYQTT
jgi:hypothetical protein